MNDVPNPPWSPGASKQPDLPVPPSETIYVQLFSGVYREALYSGGRAFEIFIRPPVPGNPGCSSEAEAHVWTSIGWKLVYCDYTNLMLDVSREPDSEQVPDSVYQETRNRLLAIAHAIVCSIPR